MASFVPQAFKILRTRDTSSLSPPMYALTTTRFLLWTVYGIGQSQWPLILNAICLLLAAFTLMMTLSARKKEAVAEALDPNDRASRASGRRSPLRATLAVSVETVGAPHRQPRHRALKEGHIGRDQHQAEREHPQSQKRQDCEDPADDEGDAGGQPDPT